MPFQRRRNFGKKPITPNSKSTRKIAQKALKLAVAETKDAELKVHNVYVEDADMDTQGTLVHLTNIDQGMGTSERIGRKITIKYINFDLNFTQNSDSMESYRVRFGLVRQLTDVVPLFSTMWDPNVTTSAPSGDFTQAYRDLDHTSHFKIIYQKDMTFPGSGSTHSIRKKKNMLKNLVVKYDLTDTGGAAADVSSGALYYFYSVEQDLTSNLGTSSNFRIRYTDE